MTTDLVAKQDELRAQVFALEREMLGMPQVELKLIHHFAPGLYAREMHVPAGVALTGAIHKHASLLILSKGSMVLATEEGPKLVSAPYTVVSPPGAKRAGVAIEDCVWTGFFVTDETDPDTIVKQATTNDEQEYLAFRGALQLEGK